MEQTHCLAGHRTALLRTFSYPCAGTCDGTSHKTHTSLMRQRKRGCTNLTVIVTMLQRRLTAAGVRADIRPALMVYHGSKRRAPEE